MQKAIAIVENKRQKMIEYLTPDKLTGTTIGDYRLEQLVGKGNWGPVFLARANGAATAYMLHVVAGPGKLGMQNQQVYLERFQHQMKQVANLQHPNILPLLDYGMFHGMFYLVSPYIPMRSLHTRLTKNGALDIFTVGRYIDQVSATLEYAHQNAVIHGGLSVDCIYIRLDGQLVVSDFGVKNLLLMENTGMLNEWSGGYAPEQLLGKPAGTYTDVYALGAVLYSLLTGSPVFTGSTPEEIIQQHLYASVPAFSRWGKDLPAGLYSIVARALAKNPAQRFRRPGALANAYNRNVAPNNGLRVPFIVDSSPALPAYKPERPSVSKTSGTDMRFTERKRSDNGSIALDSGNGMSAQSSLNGKGMQSFLSETEAEQGQALPQLYGENVTGIERSLPETPLPPTLPFFPESDLLSQREARQSSLMRRFQQKNVRRTLPMISLVIILLVVFGTIATALVSRGGGTAQGLGASGQVTFFDGQNGSQGHTGALNIVIHGLNAPPAGSQYAAWLIDDSTEQVNGLGTLTRTNSNYSLSYIDDGTNNLLTTGDKLEITLEQGTVKLPAGQVILVGKFPPQAFAHIQHLLVSFPATPGKIGVLVGSLEQTRLLNVQADVLQGLAPAHNNVAITCAAQSIIDVIEGSHGPHYRSLGGSCAAENITATGDGFGLLSKGGYLDDSGEHATLAITQPDATNTMRLHARLMSIAISNLKGWVTTIEQDALSLFKNPSDTTKIQEIVTLADNAYHGVDANGDGQIDPVAGEAGALTAYLQGQLMATLPLTPLA